MTSTLQDFQLPIDTKGIMAILPHRYPFLLVDRIVQLEPGKTITGIKNVTINEPFFQGHFPGEPVMPGVLILEAMGQVGSVMMAAVPGAMEEKLIVFLTTIENAKFRKPVKPGDQLRTEATLVRHRGRVGKVSFIGTVDGEVVAEAVMGFVTATNLTKSGEK